MFLFFIFIRLKIFQNRIPTKMKCELTAKVSVKLNYVFDKKVKNKKRITIEKRGIINTLNIISMFT